MAEHNHDHDHSHDHGHGHANDQGIRGMLRYLRFAPSMWRSEINDAVLGLVNPQPGERVVDIGAGMGAGTVVAAASGARVVAVEPTPFLRRVLSARRLFRRDRKRIKVVNGAVEMIPLADSSANALWAVNAMHHFGDMRAGAVEIHRVLKPGGRVVLIDEDFEDPSHPEFERFADRHGDGAGGHEGFSMVDADDMAEHLSEAGLVGISAGRTELAGRPVIQVLAES